MATVSSLLNYLGALPQSLMVVDEDDNDIALTVTKDRVIVSFPSKEKDQDEARTDTLVFFEPHTELSELANRAPDVVSKESRTDDPEKFKEPEKSEDPLDESPKSEKTTEVSPDSATHSPKKAVDGTDVSKEKKSETMKDEPSQTHNTPPTDKSKK